MHIAQAEALRKYGTETELGQVLGVRLTKRLQGFIGPNLLVTDDADLLRHMSAPRARWTRGNWYDGMKMDPRVNNIPI